MKGKEENLAQAHPFINYNFSSPHLCDRSGEFIAIANKEHKVFLIKSNLILKTFELDASKFDDPTKIVIRTFQDPLVVLVNDSPYISIIQKNTLKTQRLPIFLIAKHCAILGPNKVAVGDKNHVFTWNLDENKCKHLFSSSSEILDIHSSSEKIFVLTKNSFHVINKDTPVSSISLQIPEHAKLLSSYDSTAFFVYGDNAVLPILVDDREITMRQSMQVPSNCIMLAPVGRRGRELFGIFDSEKTTAKVLKRAVSGTSEWSEPVEVPLISTMCGSNCFAIAAGPQFLLVISDIHETFDAFSKPGSTFWSVLEASKNLSDADLFDALMLQFGAQQVADQLENGIGGYESLIPHVCEELWRRKLYKQWSGIALKWPRYVNEAQNPKYIMEASNTPGTPIIQFAAILEKRGNTNNAFELYVKEKMGQSVAALINKCDGKVVQEHVEELVELVSEYLKKPDEKDKDVARAIIRYFCINDVLIDPEKVVSQIKFDWELLSLYYTTFEVPPKCVVEAYLGGIATHEPQKLMKFLKETKHYDAGKACNMLLRLGLMDEYEYLVSQSSPEKYIEFLIFRNKWGALIDAIKKNKSLLHTAVQLVSYDRDYFNEFSRRILDTGIKFSDIVKEIPQECPAQNLSNGFKVISNKVAITADTEIKAQEICHQELFKVLKKKMDKKTKPTIVKL